MIDISENSAKIKVCIVDRKKNHFPDQQNMRVHLKK